MRRHISIGIDPGANGAIAAVDVDGLLVLGVALARTWAVPACGESQADRMQADLSWAAVAEDALLKIGLREGDSVRVTIEAPQLRPGQSGGASQGWRAGALGAAVMAAARRITDGRESAQVVTGTAWTKAMGLHGDHAAMVARKRMRVARVLELVPDARPMLVGPGCRVEHDGAADAILLALYGADLGLAS